MFQRIARREKKAFFHKQCINIEENNRRRTARDLFWKIGNIKEIFCPKMGTIKDRNGKDLREAEKIEEKRSRKERKNTHNCTKKILTTQITTEVQSLTQNQTFWSVKSSGP